MDSPGAAIGAAVKQTSPLESADRRLLQHRARLADAAGTLDSILGRLRGEQNSPNKPQSPKPLRSGLLGSIEEQLDVLADGDEILQARISELNSLV